MMLEALVNTLGLVDKESAAKISNGMDVGSEEAQVKRDERLTLLQAREKALHRSETYIDKDKHGHLFPRYESKHATA